MAYSKAKLVPRVCETCTGPFHARPTQVRNGGGRFCSSRCRALGQPRESLEDRLWANVTKTDDKDSCWPFTGFVNEDGYGIIGVGNGRTEGAHRVAFRLQGGVLLPGQKVLHTCDNPPCCRGKHLFAGSQADNVADMVAKGRRRGPRGEAHPSARLTEDDVREIRAAEIGSGELMRRYGISRGTVYDIQKLRSWTHVS